MEALDIAEKTILRMISEANLGTDQTGHFRKHDDIASELGETNDSLQPTTDKLLAEKLIRVINERFEQVHSNALDYTAYQITELGKSYIQHNNMPS